MLWVSYGTVLAVGMYWVLAVVLCVVAFNLKTRLFCKDLCRPENCGYPGQVNTLVPQVR